MTTETAAKSFYGPEGLAFPYLITQQTRSGIAVVAQQGPTFRHSEQLDPAQVDEAIDEVARSLWVLTAGGSTFEVGIANNEAARTGTMLHISTYSSAISTNHGNGYEFAAQAVRYPWYRHLYVASFGNGSTSPLLPEDVAYAEKTGQFTKEVNGQIMPIESLQNLHTALKDHGLDVTKIMGTDSAGGHYARGLATAMENGQLSHAFFSETSGFVNFSSAGLALRILAKEGYRNAKRNNAISSDPEKMDKEKIARFTLAFEKYADLPNRVELAQAQVSLPDKLKSMRTSMRALKRGPRGAINPLVHDSNALIARHPEAELTYGVAEHDPLYKNPETSRQAARQFLGALSVGYEPVQVALIPGMTHAYNTYFPSLYHAIKRDALEL